MRSHAFTFRVSSPVCSCKLILLCNDSRLSDWLFCVQSNTHPKSTVIFLLFYWRAQDTLVLVDSRNVNMYLSHLALCYPALPYPTCSFSFHPICSWHVVINTCELWKSSFMGVHLTDLTKANQKSRFQPPLGNRCACCTNAGSIRADFLRFPSKDKDKQWHLLPKDANTVRMCDIWRWQTQTPKLLLLSAADLLKRSCPTCWDFLVLFMVKTCVHLGQFIGSCALSKLFTFNQDLDSLRTFAYQWVEDITSRASQASR